MSLKETSHIKGRYEGLKVTKSNNVFQIQFNRPHRKNAFSTQMFIDFNKALQEAAEDKDVRITVITGTGEYYSSGNDLNNFLQSAPQTTPQDARPGTLVVENIVKTLIDYPKPVIALVNGPAVGIAVTLLGLCDAVYCSDRATFHTPFTQLAQNPEGCSSYIFPRLMGGAKATEMLLFNQKITAQEAYERNLVTRVIPDAEFHDKTQALVKYVASLPPQSVRFSKQLIRSNDRELLHRVNVAELDVLAERIVSDEVRDAVMAFFSRQKSKL